MRALALTTSIALGLFGLAAQPVHAGDDFYDWSCNALYVERNGIYRDAGYCFKTARAIKTFGNAGCQFDDINDVPLSTSQRRVIKSIVAAERAKGC